MPRVYGALGRPDPFFQTSKPHSNNFLESLHRTYGSSDGTLPFRNDASFEKALEFRRKEKAKYTDIEKDNENLRSQVEAMQRAHASLRSETDQIRSLWEELSKVKVQEDERSAKRGGIEGGIRPGSGENGVVQPPKTRSTRRRSARVAPIEQVASVSTGEEDDMRREVLPTSSIPDTRGQAEQHTSEGSEPRSGSPSPPEPSDAGNAVQGD